MSRTISVRHPGGDAGVTPDEKKKEKKKNGRGKKMHLALGHSIIEIRAEYAVLMEAVMKRDWYLG